MLSAQKRKSVIREERGSVSLAWEAILGAVMVAATVVALNFLTIEECPNPAQTKQWVSCGNVLEGCGNLQGPEKCLATVGGNEGVGGDDGGDGVGVGADGDGDGGDGVGVGAG